MPGKRDRGSVTKAEEAFTVIRRQIERGRLAGRREAVSAESLGRDADEPDARIREALRMLQAHGLVEYRPHHGHVVTRYSIPRAEEVYLLRETLEPLATRLASERATAGELEEIRSLDEECRAAARRRTASRA